MLSVGDIAAVKVAVEICNNPELKREILRAPDVDKKRRPYDGKKQWYEKIDKKASVVVKRLGLPGYLQKKVMGVVLQIGMRMLTWAEYHEMTVGFSREYSSTFLKSSFFTYRGIIDNKKAAAELMSDKILSIEQKYKLACLYCFTDHIAALHGQMTQQDKKKFYDPGPLLQTKLVTFWSYYLTGEVDDMRRGKSVDMFRLEVAVLSGCKEAVEYCLERTNLKRNRHATVEAAVQAVCSMGNNSLRWLFKDQTYGGRWIPVEDYYRNIFCFLLSRMTEDQQINVLKTCIHDDNFICGAIIDQDVYRILAYFLNWPYQDYFMKMARLMWEFLPEKNYFLILLMICDMIVFENLKYGEEKSYNYGELLKEFWSQSPNHYKRYVLSNQKMQGRRTTGLLKTDAGLLGTLLSLKNFTHEYRKIIELILASATVEEKENFSCSKELKNAFFEQMKEEKWEVLDWFAMICDSSKQKFRREFIFSEEARNGCIYFIKNGRWDAAESFVKWSFLPEAEADKLKKSIIDSEEGRCACVYLLSHERKLETVDKFVAWCFPSEKEAKAFKKKLIFSYEGMDHCADLVSKGQANLVNEFISYGLLSEGEIKELKKNVARKTGSSTYEILISDYRVKAVYDEEGDKIGRRTEFQGGQWEEVEMFVTWCFSSEEEISDFKKNVIQMRAVDIHFKLICSNQWEEAETFFVWLGLSTKEIRKLKKDTLYEFGMEEINELLLENGLPEFPDYAYGKWEKIELYLRWCLTDKETALEFKKKFDEVYGFKSYAKGAEIPENKIIGLNKFYLLIEELLNNLSRKSEGAEKRPEISVKEFPNKRLRDINFGN